MIFEPVDGLSSDEEGPGAAAAAAGPAVPVVKQRKPRSGRIRCVRAAKALNDVEKLVADAAMLRKRLSQQCGCSKNSCCSQFSAAPKFEEYHKYLSRWVNLAKLDQDQIET